MRAISVLAACAVAILSFLILLQALSPGWRCLPIISFIVFWSGIAVALVLGVFRGVFPLRDDRWTAGMIGRVTGRDTFYVSALEFSRRDERHEAYSQFLMTETARRARDELGRLDRKKLFAGTGGPAWTAAGLLAGLVLLVQVMLAWHDASRVFAALMDPALSFRSPRGFSLAVTSGDVSILAGGSATAEAVKFGSAEGEVALRASSIPGVWKRIPIMPDTIGIGGTDHFFYRHRIVDVTEDLVYYYEAGGERTEQHRIDVIHRPVINRVKVLLTYPAYTGAEPVTLGTLAGRIAAVAGTRVELSGETSKEISSGRLAFRTGADVDLGADGKGFQAGFTITRDDTFTIEVTDGDGLTNERPVGYPVVAVSDHPPSIEIFAPGDESLLPRSLVTELMFRASDDYGVLGVGLRYMREGKDERFRTTVLSIDPGTDAREIEQVYHWSLENVHVRPGDRIAFYLEARDGNPAGGYARTETRRLLVPSLSEIYAEIHDVETFRRDELDGIVERGKEIKERLEKLSDDFKADGLLDWGRRREGREILERQRELREKIAQTAGELDRTLEKLERNSMTTQEIGRKMEEIHDLLRRIESEEMREAIEKFNRMLGEVPEEEIVRAMDEMELAAEGLVEKLDRAIELLKRILKEEKMEEIVRRMEGMLEEQRGLRDSSATGDEGELSRQQEQLGDEFERFEEDFSDFASEDHDSILAAEMEKVAGDIEKSDLDEMMRQAARELQGGERQQSRCTQDGAINKMLKLYTELGSCMSSMSIPLGKEMAERLERAARDMLEVSRLEEAIVPGIRGGVAAGSRKELISRQLELKSAARSLAVELYNLARKTMSVSDGVFLHLGAGLSFMEASLQEMEEERFSRAAKLAESVYRELNLAVIEILRSSQSAGGGSAGTQGMMQSMFNRQQSIDRQLRELFEQGNTGRWSMEERAAMSRIAAEQREMRDLMEQITEESRGARRQLGRLDDLAGEMEGIAERLGRGELDGELLDREERILSRMLESQRSLQRRDYKRERASTTAGEYRALAPGPLGRQPGEAEILLEMIRRGMQERGPAEYEELIRRYFRALSKRVRER